MNYNIFLIKLLLLSNFNLLSAAISPNHQLVLAAAIGGDFQTVQDFCINPNETVGKKSALYATVKHNRSDIAYLLLERGAEVDPSILIRAVTTCNRPLTLAVLEKSQFVFFHRGEKKALKNAALKAGDAAIIRLLAQRNLIHLDKKQPQKKIVASLETEPVESNAENLECAICLEPLSMQTNNIDKKFFHCIHGSNHFHLKCVKKSIEQTNTKCPLCRSGLKA
ncbi:MAG: E3 ubiquitin protein ligase [Candidatus Babeliales bacterium]|jgi:hypothetical protein